MTDQWSVACRVGLWGAFDLEDLGPLLRHRVLRHEIARRLPGAEIRSFAPLGHLRPTPLDAGDPTEPFGPWTDNRLDALAGELDCIVVEAGDALAIAPEEFAARYGEVPPDAHRFLVEALGGEREGRCPVIRRDGEVPDPILLTPRLFPPELLEKRLAFLRMTGRYPESGAALVVQASAALLPHAPGVAAGVRETGLPAVLLDASSFRGDREFADALAGLLAGPVHRLPLTAVEDATAAIAAAAGVVADSSAACLLAAAYGRPWAALHSPGEPAPHDDPLPSGPHLVADPADIPAALRAAPVPLDLLVERLDAHFDCIAAIAEAASRERPGQTPEERLPALEEHLRALRRAHEVRGRRLVDEWVAISDTVQGLLAEVARLGDELAAATSLAERLHAELEGLKATRTFRYTARARELYMSIRSWLR